LVEGGSGTFFQIGLQELRGGLVELGGFARGLFGGERFAVGGHLGVAFDGGEGEDPESAGGLALAHTSLESLDYLGSLRSLE
jgi:hypothetical protein